MTIRSILGFLVVVLAVGFALAALPATANAQNEKDEKQRKVEREDDDDDDDEDLTAEDKQQVKVSMQEARTIALRRVNGKVLDEELEKEKGRLQYAFDIRDEDGKVWDVEIDAISGEVLQALEDDDDDDDVDSKTSKRTVKKKVVERTAKVTKVKPN
jgi:uncharacterized membrane protein YkoI